MSKVDFGYEIQCIENIFLQGSTPIGKFNKIKAILCAASESGLSLEEIVLLLKGDVRERLYAMSRGNYLRSSLRHRPETCEELYYSISPQGGKEATQNG